jgi:hypothetical protein
MAQSLSSVLDAMVLGPLIGFGLGLATALFLRQTSPMEMVGDTEPGGRRQGGQLAFP